MLADSLMVKELRELVKEATCDNNNSKSSSSSAGLSHVKLQRPLSVQDGVMHLFPMPQPVKVICCPLQVKCTHQHQV